MAAAASLGEDGGGAVTLREYPHLSWQGELSLPFIAFIFRFLSEMSKMTDVSRLTAAEKNPFHRLVLKAELRSRTPVAV